MAQQSWFDFGLVSVPIEQRKYKPLFSPSTSARMFPRFLITRRLTDRVTGVLSTVFANGERWVDDAWLGYLKRDKRFIHGRWHRGADEWTFVPEDDAEALAYENEWEVFDCYWGERAELVIDDSRTWRKAAHINTEHDHCAICWQKIGQYGELEGYVTADGEWVCLTCYRLFVEKRSLGFITPQVKPHYE